MKFLIGVLVLLFVLTTMGFSEIANAESCELVFQSETPEYSRAEYEAYVNEFYGNTQYFMERNHTRNNFDGQYNEFNTQRSESEFNYNENF